jgi:hypothetical protein
MPTGGEWSVSGSGRIVGNQETIPAQCSPMPDFPSVDGVLSVIAFHEEAGRSQVSSFVFSLDKGFLFRRVARCRYPSIRTLVERIFARCKLGVLVSAGAAS